MSYSTVSRVWDALKADISPDVPLPGEMWK